MIKLSFIENLMDVLPFKSQIWELLCICDKDFYPTLSSRENSENGPKAYFETLFSDNSKFILALVEEQVVGFSIFFHNYSENLFHQFTPCNYVKIACVHPSYRGLKIASTFNRFIEEELPSHLVLPYIVRRTWSTNLPQMSLLKNYGYELFHQNINDRGNNVSTVYFYKSLPNRFDVNQITEVLPLSS